MVDIFEAGPLMTCPLNQIRTVRDSRRAEVTQITDDPIDSQTFLIGNTDRDFRACSGPVAVEDTSGVRLNRLTAMALNVKVGEPIRYAPLRVHPQKKGGMR